jgi:hypothetical protein
MGRRGHYSVHNARCAVERYLGPRIFFPSETREAGRYNCSLQYPTYGRDKICVDVTATTKDEARNLAFYKFAKRLFVAGKIPAARR